MGAKDEEENISHVYLNIIFNHNIYFPGLLSLTSLIMFWFLAPNYSIFSPSLVNIRRCGSAFFYCYFHSEKELL